MSASPWPAGLRWIIRNDRSSLANPNRRWQLWLVAGELMGLKAERSQHRLCVQAMQRLIESGPDFQDEICCDSHNRHCESPSELCCWGCSEAAHDTFPIRHADGSRCVLDG